MRKLLTLTRRMPWSERQEGSQNRSPRSRWPASWGWPCSAPSASGPRRPRPPPASCSGPTVTSKPFGTAFDLYAGRQLPVFQYTLKNCKGMTVQILSYGAITQSITVPDKNGNLADVVLGFKTLERLRDMASPPPPDHRRSLLR